MNRDESTADRIRRRVEADHVAPARRSGAGSVTVRAGDVARDLRLADRIPAICGALESNLFQARAGVRLTERRGPRQSTTTEFVFAILDGPGGTDRNDEGASPRRTVGDAPGRDRRAGAADGVGNRLYLVSCVKTKRDAPASAKDLYVSDWFRKARACVEKTGRPWRILSARHGLVHPEREIRPYELTLNAMPVAERRAWAQDVLAGLATCLDGVDTVVFFAGRRYREFLEPALRRRGLAVDTPMEGLSQGRQLAWLSARLHD